MIQTDLENGRLTENDIIGFIARHDRARCQRMEQYNRGANPTILGRTFKDVTVPHNNIPVSYARKIVNTVAGYMFKPGLIGYASENDVYLQTLKDIFDANDEDVKSSVVGRQTCVQGVGYELHYTLGTEPRFAKIDAEEMIPVYDYQVEPGLIAAIRHYRRSGAWKVEVYYADRIEYFRLEDAERPGDEARLIRENEAPHLYGTVPLVVYRNNEEMVGDFEPVVKLIDAYDILVSDSLNEFDRFSQAYLVLKGMKLKPEDYKDIKNKRVFQDSTRDWDIQFLTKDIPSGFIEFMTGLVKREIHKQSHVPDFSEAATGQFTGAALDRLLYDFELVASVKEAFFKQGLYNRIRLIDAVLAKQNKASGDVNDITITMNRNKPTSLIEMGDAMQKYAGIVSDKTLIENFAPFVEDAQDEIDQRDAESAARMPDVFAEDADDAEGRDAPAVP